MTSDAGQLTLWSLFFGGEAVSPHVASTLESHEAMAEVRKQVTEAAGGLAGAVKDSLLDAFRSALSTPIDEVLGGAWRTYADLLEYCDPKEHPPDETALHPLLSHTIESTYEPSVEVILTGFPPTSIPFAVRVAFTIEAVTLKIQGGKIWEVRTGSCLAEGSISCGPVSLAERKSPSLELPGTLKFPNGLAIAPR